MAYLYYRHKFMLPTPKGRLAQLPRVTIQLPVFNEMYVVKRLIDSVCAIRYPRELLEIQVLDDSIDETCGIARAACVERQKALGLDIQYIHRTNRMGFKAGALENGLKLAKGQFRRGVRRRLRTGSRLPRAHGAVLLGRGRRHGAGALGPPEPRVLDSHAGPEHLPRRPLQSSSTPPANRSGCFLQLQRHRRHLAARATIESAGGWQHDTLTEDLDLSYRAQMKGWNFIFLPEVISPAEVPVDMNAFKSQQHRWAKGSIQTAKKLLPAIMRSNLPFKVKREAFLFT